MLLLAMVAATVTSALLTWVLIGVLRRLSILDVPIGRSSHRTAVPRGGGLALAIGALVAVGILHSWVTVITAAAILVAAIGDGALGLADDLTGHVPVPVRLAGQTAVAAVAVAMAMHARHLGTAWLLVAGLIGVVWTVGFTNAFNFMDGINGIAGAQAIVAGVALGLVGRHVHTATLEVASFALAASAVGFLPFNFPKARVFLGDVGSYFAGSWLAMLVVVALVARVPLEAAIAPMALFAADAGATLARRIATGQSWRTAHRDHVYQRLFDSGWSQVAVVCLVVTAVGACSALGWVSLVGSATARAVADLGVVVILLVYLSLPSLANRRAHGDVGRSTNALDREEGA